MKDSLKKIVSPYYYRYILAKNRLPYNKYQMKYQCIFIHIPKTGGTSVIDQLSKGKWVPRNHTNWKEYQKRSAFFYKSFFKFAFVRNPWDRAVSIYSYIKQSEDAKTSLGNYSLKDIYKDKFDTFEEYVLNFLNKDVIWTHALFMPQWFYIVDEFWKVQLDYLGKFENLYDDFNYVKSVIGLEAPPLKQTNMSTRKPYREYYTESTYKKIGEIYSKDIELFNYKFD